MRALVFHEAEGRLVVETRPDPVPGESEVLVRVSSVGICGSDLHGISGENGRRHDGQVMGHELGGTVVGVGSSVSTIAAGAMVTINPVIGCGECRACEARQYQQCARRRVIGVDPAISSGFAELIVAPAQSVVPLAAGVPAWAGALVEPLSVGYHAATRGGVSAESVVLVIGGGPIGQAAAIACRRLGTDRVVVAETDPKRRAIFDDGVVRAIDPRAADFEAQMLEALEAPPDIVLDAVGSSQSLDTALTVSRFGSTVVLVGMHSPDLGLAAYAISTEERTLVGSFCYDGIEFESTAAWVGDHFGELDHLIDLTVSLDEAPETVDRLLRRDLSASKVLVSPVPAAEPGGAP